MDEEINKNQKLFSSKVYLTVGLVFIFLTAFLIVVFVFVIKLSPKKETVMNIPRGGLIDVELPTINEDEKMVVEICGEFNSQCLILQENIFGEQKDIFIPADFPTGNATVMIYVAESSLENTPRTSAIEKKITIVASDGPNSDDKSFISNELIDNTIASQKSGLPTPVLIPTIIPKPLTTPMLVNAPSPGMTIINTTPTPTPFLYNTDHPVLINH